VAIDSTSAASFTTLSFVLYTMGKFADADAAAKHAIKVDRKFAKAYYVRARITLSQGDANESLVMLDRYLEFCPLPGLVEPGHPYWLRGSALYELCRPRDALNNFLMARILSP